MAGRILDCTTEEYFGDPCATPSLSSGIAHALVSESPLHAYTKHPRLGGYRGGGGSKAMNDGTLIHKLLLGKGKDIALIDAPDFRTKAAQQARDNATAAGQLPILQHAYAEKSAIAAKLRETAESFGIVFDGASEVPIEWTDRGSNGDVLCRSMLDHMWIDQGRIIDVKTTRSANPRQVARSVYDYGYDIQYAAYTRALAALRPEFAGRIDFVFLFVEIEPPYSVVPARLDGALREIGAGRWEAALNLWEKCLAEDRWPGYGGGEPVTLEAPHWLVTQQIGTWES